MQLKLSTVDYAICVRELLRNDQETRVSVSVYITITYPPHTLPLIKALLGESLAPKYSKNNKHKNH